MEKDNTQSPREMKTEEIVVELIDSRTNDISPDRYKRLARELQSREPYAAMLDTLWRDMLDRIGSVEDELKGDMNTIKLENIKLKRQLKKLRNHRHDAHTGAVMVELKDE